MAMSCGISIQLAEALVVRAHEHAAASDAELAHHGRMRALQDLADLAFGAAAAAAHA